MKKLTTTLISFLLLAGTPFFFIACSDDNLDDAADEVGDAMKEGADNVKDAAKDAADAVEDATN